MNGIMSNLPKTLNYTDTLEKVASYRGNDKHIAGSLTKSQGKVIDFDNVMEHYAKRQNWECRPKSNDALYITHNNDLWFFEFKNSPNVSYALLEDKLCSSILLLFDMYEKGELTPNIGMSGTYSFIRQHLNYYLVYNFSMEAKVDLKMALKAKAQPGIKYKPRYKKKQQYEEWVNSLVKRFCKDGAALNTNSTQYKKLEERIRDLY